LGNLTALLAILIFNNSTGCSHDIGVWMALTFPLAVLGGPLVAAIAAIIVLYLLSSTEWYFDAGEREEVEQRILSLIQRFRRVERAAFRRTLFFARKGTLPRILAVIRIQGFPRPCCSLFSCPPFWNSSLLRAG
jgi:hypothetical protein